MRSLFYIVLLLSILVYRNGRPVKNVILTKRVLPQGYYHAGNFTTDCIQFDAPQLKYCEDAVFWDVQDSRHLILSCDPGRKAWNVVMGPLRNPDPHGALWLYTPGRAPQPIALTEYPQEHDFHPLGLEIWPSHDGNGSNLYVINHARQRTFIEHFILDPAKPTAARHVRTISSPYFLSPNSIALTSPYSFFLSNDHLMTRRIPIVGNFLSLFESVLSLPFGYVLHVTLSPDDQPTILNISLPVPFVPFANGVALSPDGSTLAVASSSLAQVRLYDRDPATNTLTRRAHTIDFPFAADNVRFSDDGTLFVAGHPHFPSLIHLSANKTEVSPSWAIAIPPLSERLVSPTEFDLDAPTSSNGLVPGVPGMTTVFQSDGQGFSSAATALKDDKTGALYVTGLYAEKGFIVCKPSA